MKMEAHSTAKEHTSRQMAQRTPKSGNRKKENKRKIHQAIRFCLSISQALRVDLISSQGWRLDTIRIPFSRLNPHIGPSAVRTWLWHRVMMMDSRPALLRISFSLKRR